ncbi:MAG: DUF4013 domain-containing protein [Candidatus Woesearchaeota archaeon]
MVEYIKAVKLPFSDWKKLGIGTLIGIAATYVPLLNILAMFFISGYSAIIAKSAMKKKLVLPEWEKWGDMLLTGAKICLIDIAYLAIPTILMVIGVGSALAGIGLGLMDFTPEIISERVAAAVGIGGLGAALILLASLLYLVAYYFLPMALMNFLAKGNIGAAFNFGEVARKALRAKYLVALLFMAAYVIVAGMAAGILDILTAATYVGPLIVSGALVTLIAITAYSVFGQVYAEK